MKNIKMKIMGGTFIFLLVVLFITISSSVNKPKLTLVAGEDYVSEEVIVLADSEKQAKKIADLYGVKLKSYSYGVAVFETSNPEQLVKLSEGLEKEDMPKLGLNWIYKTYNVDIPRLDTYKPNRQGFKKKTETNVNVSELDWYHKEMYTEKAWEYATGEGVTVAVIDTGISVNHPAFEGKISEISYNSHLNQIGTEYVEDDGGHGTHVSGIIAASNMNTGETIVSGVAPYAEILAIKSDMPEDPGFFESSSLIRGINYAVENGADIINMSLGRFYDAGPDEVEVAAIKNAVENGVTVIAAAGNDSYEHAGYPAAYEEVIAVSATSENYSFALHYSNYGPEIDIAAPGTNIYSTSAVGTPLDDEYGDGSGYLKLTGTSMASPNVAGVAALIVSQNPDYTPQEIREIIIGSAQEAGDLGYDNYFGNGIVSAYAALVGEEELLEVTYNLEDTEKEPVVAKVAQGSTLIRPKIYIEHDNYNAWYIDKQLTTLFDYSTKIEENIMLYEGYTELSKGTWIKEFPDDVFRSMVMTEIGISDELSIITEENQIELSKFIEVGLDFSGITDLTGIKYITNLEILSCAYNILTNLDLSNNIHLLEVYCPENNIEMVNINGLKSLEEFIIPNNDVSTLNVSTNISLEMLDLRLNNIESEDDVIGWEDIGLEKEKNFMFDPGPILITNQPIKEYSNEGIERSDYKNIPGVQIGAIPKNGIDLEFQWYINTTGEISGGIPLSGETTPSLSPNTWRNEIGINYYYCEIKAIKDGKIVSTKVSDISKITNYIQPMFSSTMGKATIDAHYVTTVGGSIGIAIDSGSYVLNQIIFDDSENQRVLVEEIDYTFENYSETYIQFSFNQTFLETLPVGTYYLTFDMEGGAGKGLNPILKLIVSDEKIELSGELLMQGNIAITAPGKDLSANLSELIPTKVLNSLIPQWSRSETIDGEFVPIESAGNFNYVVQEDDIGYYLQMSVKGTGAYTGEVLSNKILVKETAPILEKIVVTNQPIKTEYLFGESIDLTGLEVTAYYNDNTSRIITKYGTNPEEGEVLKQTSGFDAFTITSVYINYNEDGVNQYTSFQITIKPEVPTELTSDIFVFDQDNNLVSNIKEGTTVKEILNGLKEKSSKYYPFIEIQKDGVPLRTKEIVTTGTKLLIIDWDAYDGNTLIRTYDLAVKGDLNGDGKITITDVSKLYSYLANKSIMTESYNLKASDINNDGKITITDVSKLYSYVNKTIGEL